jgi:4-hydroxy-tetrahydrodipicolinate reductase
MKLALLGYGRMGRAVHEIATGRGHIVTAVLDEADNADGSGITEAALGGARIAIDFSTSAAVLPNVRRASALGVGMVVGTTGWEGDRLAVEEAVRSAGTGLLDAPNFSVGMFLFSRVVEGAARLINHVEEFDVHLRETHHRFKVDHPGGTARALAGMLVRELDRKDGWTIELQDGVAPDPRMLQVAVARVGQVPGIHEVALEGPDERIELRHEARSRKGFARGAVLAAEWMENRSGIFTMTDLMDDLLS